MRVNYVEIKGKVRDGVHAAYENVRSSGYHQVHFNLALKGVIIQVRVNTEIEYFDNNALENDDVITITGELAMDADDYYILAKNIT